MENCIGSSRLPHAKGNPALMSVPAHVVFPTSERVIAMAAVQTIQDYLRMYAPEMGQRILEMYPPLHRLSDSVSPSMKTLLRRPYPAQELAAMGVFGGGSGPEPLQSSENVARVRRSWHWPLFIATPMEGPLPRSPWYPGI